MTATLSRSDFLRHAVRGWKLPARPPWAKPEDEFIAACTKCGDCLSACAENIIINGQHGFPEINFDNGECTFCGDCVTACDVPAFDYSPNSKPWTLTAKILDHCLSSRGISCRVCGDQCEPRAIQFKLGLRGVADPIIDNNSCTGCGACVGPCPVDAIEIVGEAHLQPASTTSVSGENRQ